MAERRLDAVADRISIDDALEALPEEFRAAVVLRDVADLDYAEIAEVLDIPIGTVKSRIARGRGQLAERPREPGRCRRTSNRRPTAHPHHHDMTYQNDHSELDQRRLLASAYVDGELTAVERASAEGDANVMNEVATLRDVRRRLAVDETPDAARREAAIRAALAAGGPAVVAPPPPSALARRRARWLAPLAAAAAVVAVVGGVVALRSTDDGGDDVERRRGRRARGR